MILTGLCVTVEQVDRLVEHARQTAPEEACGLLAGRGMQIEVVYPVTNQLHSPTRFQMDAREQLRAFHQIEENGMELLAIYHSHPRGPAGPSPTDVSEFAYPGVAYLILDGGSGEWRAALYCLDGGQVRPVYLKVVDRS